jgi:drug/metabolite transporter (DMT)-like permease
MVVAMLAWPIVEALPALLSQPYSPFEIVWIRYGTHLVLMVCLWGPVKPSALVRTTRTGLHAVRAATMLGMPVAFVLARARMPGDAVMSIFWVEPLVAMLLGVVLLGERVAGRRWSSAAIAFAGVLMMLPPPGLLPRPSWVFPIAMAVCFALYQVLTRMMLEETTAARLFYTALGVWVPLSLGLPWFWRTPTLRDLAVMMSIGVLGYLFLLALDRAVDATPVSGLAPFALAQPIWAVLLRAALRGGVPGPGVVAGVVIVFAAWGLFAWPGRASRAVR